MRICLDFDGVIHDPTNRLPGYRMGQPVYGSRTSIELLLAQGHELVIHSARARYGDDRNHMHEWMRYFDYPPIEIVYTKPQADVYLDDKAVRFVAWPEAMAQLRQLDFSR